MNYNFFEQNSITTPTLTVKGNLIYWYNTIIQISSISTISKRYMTTKKLPMWSVLLIIVSFFVMTINVVIGIAVLLVGVAYLGEWIYIAYKNSKLQKLVFVMNSGETYTIIFDNFTFLDKVFDILSNILISDNDNSNIVFNIKDNTIINKDNTIIKDNQFNDNAVGVNNEYNGGNK